MRVLITSANGYLGKALVRAFHAAGHEVTGVDVKDPGPSYWKGPRVPWRRGEVRGPASFADLLPAQEAVILAGCDPTNAMDPVGPEAVERVAALLREAPAGGPRLLVHTTTTWVLGTTLEVPADERHPLAAPPELLGTKGEEERLVLSSADTRLATAVVRPGLVFGGAQGFISGLFESGLKGGKVLVLDSGQNRWSTVYLADLADLYVRIVESSAALAAAPLEHRIFHGVSGVSERAGDIALAAAAACGGAELERFDAAKAAFLLGSIAAGLALDQVVISTNAERLLGWRPRVRGFVRNAGLAYSEWSSN